MRGQNEINNYDDLIDSRDVIDRIEWLTDTDDDDEKDELKSLQALADEGDNYSDWIHGATLIRDSYFEEYAQDLAEDIGAVNRDQSWPNNCIDWEQAARELQMDYSTIEFEGEEYWIR